MTTKVKFKFERETKNMIRFMEVGENDLPVPRGEQVSGTIYVSKLSLGGEVPNYLIGTFEAA